MSAQTMATTRAAPTEVTSYMIFMHACRATVLDEGLSYISGRHQLPIWCPHAKCMTGTRLDQSSDREGHPRGQEISLCNTMWNDFEAHLSSNQCNYYYPKKAAESGSTFEPRLGG